jgi:hypothetical protein
MSASDNLGKQFTASGKKRHKKITFSERGGISIGCEHCDEYGIKHPTRLNKGIGTSVNQFDYRDKQGMKEAWEAHKAENQ